MIHRLHPILYRYCAPVPENIDELGSSKDLDSPKDADRGDDFKSSEKNDDDDNGDDEEGEGEPEEGEKEGEEEEGEGEEGLPAAKKAEAKPTLKGKDDDGKKKDPRIPLKRHEEILNKERERRQALEQELVQTRAGAKVVATNEKIEAEETKLAGLEDKYAKAVIDGEVAEVTKLIKEIRTIERNINEMKAEARETALETRAVERTRYDVAVERIESAYPVLNPDNEDYDKEKTSEVLELMDAYQRTGKYTPTQALQKAVKVLIKPSSSKQEDATTVTPRAKPDEVKTERKQAALDKALAAAEKTPPSMAKVGADSDKAGGSLKASDVMRMSQKEFAKLDEATLSKLRGDTL